MSTSIASAAVPVPRPSASLVVVNGRNEVLLVHRNPNASSFGGFHVFPGGNFDKNQDESLAITALRETFEESGLLLAYSSSDQIPSDKVLDEGRHSIHQQKVKFQDFLKSHNIQLDVTLLLPFTQWITPVGPPRRFHTQFFVAFLPRAPSSGFSFGEKQDRIPRHDGGQEVIEARFVHPTKALDECREGKISVMPPQYYILSTLADVLDGPVNTTDQRNKVETLSRGNFGKMVINPRRLAEDEHGRTILTYEGDEARGGPKGRMHRALVKIRSGAPTEISLMRNFDVFTEIEVDSNLTSSSKL